MKTNFKIFLKSASLAILFISVAYGLYAMDKYENLLGINAATSKYKNQLKKSGQTIVKLAQLNQPEIKENVREIEDWMLNEKFWQIEGDIYQEPVEKELEDKEWIKKFDFNICGSIDIYSDFVDKEWMKEQSFYIL